MLDKESRKRMIDEYDARKIAEEAAIAKKALDRLIYCGMRGGFGSSGR